MVILMATSCYCSGRGLHFESCNFFLCLRFLEAAWTVCAFFQCILWGQGKGEETQVKMALQGMIGCGVPAGASFTVTVTP